MAKIEIIDWVELKQKYLRIANIIVSHPQPYDELDMYLLSIIQRTILQNRAIEVILNDKNYEPVYPMMRTLLDSILNIRALDLVEDVHLFCRAVLNGTPIKKLHEKDGKKLTESKIADSFEWNEYQPGIKKMYTLLCGHVHFSSTHLSGILPEINTISIGQSIIADHPDLIDNIYGNITDINQVLIDMLQLRLIAVAQ